MPWLNALISYVVTPLQSYAHFVYHIFIFIVFKLGSCAEIKLIIIMKHFNKFVLDFIHFMCKTEHYEVNVPASYVYL